MEITSNFYMDYYRSKKSGQQHQTYFSEFPAEIISLFSEKKRCREFFLDGITPATRKYEPMNSKGEILPEFKSWSVCVDELHLKEIRQQDSRFFDLFDKMIEMENQIVLFMTKQCPMQVYQLHFGNFEFESFDDPEHLLMRNCTLIEKSVFIGIE